MVTYSVTSLESAVSKESGQTKSSAMHRCCTKHIDSLSRRNTGWLCLSPHSAPLWCHARANVQSNCSAALSNYPVKIHRWYVDTRKRSNSSEEVMRRISASRGVFQTGTHAHTHTHRHICGTACDLSDWKIRVWLQTVQSTKGQLASEQVSATRWLPRPLSTLYPAAYFPDAVTVYNNYLLFVPVCIHSARTEQTVQAHFTPFPRARL